MAIKTHRGSCHCGDVKYEADLDLEAGTGKCNCSICQKTRNWSVRTKPEGFRLLTSEAKLSDYQFATLSGHHLFCKRCGVRSFSRGYVEQIGGDYVAITVSCLDDASDEEIAAAPVRFANGRDNDWMHTPKVTSFL